MADIVRLAAYGALLLLGYSFTGRFFPPGDSLAAFRPELAGSGAFAVLVLLRQRRRTAAAVASVAVIVSLASILRFAWPQPPAAPQFALYQHNLFHANTQLDRDIAQIRILSPDALTFQEVSRHRDRLVAELGGTFPHYRFCSYRSANTSGSVGVMARDLGPMIDSGCAEKTEFAWITLQTASGPVTFAALHLFWPWPMGQAGQFDYLEPVLERLHRPVILGGDFNNVPWSHVVGRIARSIEGEVAPGLASTFRIFGLWPRLRIDHVIGPAGARVVAERMPQLGSDHNGLSARIALP